jgi:2-oxoisovalerate dehydrogenase E1 component
VFCLQNNQTALSTPVADQSAVRTFADKADGYGIPGITIDGTDPDEMAAAFAWAVERARGGLGPALIELVCMRMCGHAHHDDMLYLGKDPQPSWDYPSVADQGYANRELYAFWSARDPLTGYAAVLESEGVIESGELDRVKREAEAIVEAEAQAVIAAPWPESSGVGIGVFADEPARTRVESLEPAARAAIEYDPPLPALEPFRGFDRKGGTFLEGVMHGVADALRADPRVFVYGEDVGGQYGNAFLLLRPLLQEFGDRILNSPLAEGAVIGV